MKKILLLFIGVVFTTQLFSQNSSVKYIKPDKSENGLTLASSIQEIHFEDLAFPQNTLNDIITSIQASIPGFRATQTSSPNQIPLLTYRNCIINDVYVDGVRCDVSILQYLNPNSIESIQVFNSVMESDIYSSNSKNKKS